MKDQVYMGWLRLVGSFKLQVPFAEYSLFYRALLQKKPRSVSSCELIVTQDERSSAYGVATISRLLQITGPFCRT